MAAASDPAPRAAQPAAFRSTVVGDSASAEGLRQLQQDLKGLRAKQASIPHLKSALKAAGARDFRRAADGCRKALEHDPENASAWHLLGIAQEKLGDWTASLEAYEKALQLNPQNLQIAADLGRLAFDMKMYPQAEALFRQHMAFSLDIHESANNLASVLRAQMRYDEAIEVLKAVIQQDPLRSGHWNTLGTVLAEMGEMEQAVTFYTEALRLDPGNDRARYNRANALIALGAPDEAVVDCRKALETVDGEPERIMMTFALASMHLAAGEFTQGWEAYQARLDPHFAEPVSFLAKGERWTPGHDIAGRHLLLFGEQGLGDEILFSNVLDDVLAALGPGGRLSLAVTPRLVSLFQRSYPQVNVGAHATLKRHGRSIRVAPFISDWSDVDVWAPLADPLRQFRLKVEDFPPNPQGFLRPDPERVAHWKEELAALPGLKVGLLWTTMTMNSTRRRFYAPWEDWEPIVRTPGVSFVNLQYGDRSADLEHARREWGVEIHQPAGIDLRDHLDDVGALASALDLVVGPANATSNIAGACGVPMWLITSRGAWTMLGTDRYPWYPQARAFVPDGSADWKPFMNGIAEALAEFALGPQAAAAAG